MGSKVTEINSFIDYHEFTSYRRGELGGPSLDWANQPDVYKHYPDLESVALPKEAQWPDQNLSEVLLGKSPEVSPVNLTLDQVSLILLLTQTLTARSRHAGGDFFYRSVPSAGALYPCELYLAVRGMKELEPGLYHYDIMNHALTSLRRGDLSHKISTRLEPRADVVPVLTFLVTAIFFRSAWKYRDRAYRYHLLDTGHLVENLTLALKALNLPFVVNNDFDDGGLNNLLGLDEHREVSLAVVSVMTESPLLGEDAPPISETTPELSLASRVAPTEIDYPVIRETHALTSKHLGIKDPDSEMLTHLGVEFGSGERLSRPQSWPEVMNYAEALWRRRSKRNFAREELSWNCFNAMMDLLCQDDGLHRMVCVGFLSGNVEGLEPGLYLLDRAEASFHVASSGHFMSNMARICLDQAWLARAGLHFLFLANLDHLGRLWGPRGYRCAMIAAGRLGQRIYIGAASMGCGACGVGAFYDDEAAKLIGLEGGSKLLYLVAVGQVKG